MAITLLPERVQPNGVRSNGRIRRFETVRTFLPKAAEDSTTAAIEEVLPLRTGYRDVYRRLQSLVGVGMRITMAAVEQEDLDRERNLLHLQARLGMILQQMNDVLPFLERLTGEASASPSSETMGGQRPP